MKRLLLLISTLLLMFLSVGCQDNAQSSTNTLHATFSVLPFEELLEDADVIAHVKIEEKIGEINEPSPKSIFSISVIDVYKGDQDLEDTKTSVYQIGNDEYLFEDNRFSFTDDEEYILFLKETADDEVSEYWISNGPFGLYQVVDDIVLNLIFHEDTLDSIALSEEALQKNLLKKQSEFNDIEQQIYNKKAFISKIDEKL